MSKKTLLPVSLVNPTSMANLNRMTYLMAISEITPQISISGQIAATLEQVQKLGITYIVNVAIESSAIVYPKHIKLEKYDIIDFPTAPISNYFNTLTDKIHAHLTAHSQNKVLVHCMAGISRSTTIVCAYLIRYMNMDLRDAYLLCKTHRPICFPNLGFWNQLIAYEHQLKKENSVKMIPTQFGYVPDVALEEIKQFYAQQQPGSVPISASPPANSANSSNTLSNQTRPTARDISVNNSASITRSRSLAPNSTSRPTMAAAASTNINNPAYQTSLFATNKQTFLSPARYGINRLVPATSNKTNNSLPAAPSASSTSYVNNRNLPMITASNMRQRHTNNHHSSTLTANATTATTANNDQPGLHYETTYRASFIKPLAP